MINFKVPEPEKEKKEIDIRLYEFNIYLFHKKTDDIRHHKAVVFHNSQKEAEKLLEKNLSEDELLKIFNIKIKLRKYAIGRILIQK